jgi:hypothetical protein
VRLRLVGDVVFTTPAIRALRRHFPQARLDYLVEAGAAPIVRHNPHLDTVIEVDRPRGLARLFYDLSLARRLRRERYQVRAVPGSCGRPAHRSASVSTSPGAAAATPRACRGIRRSCPRATPC